LGKTAFPGCGGKVRNPLVVHRHPQRWALLSTEPPVVPNGRGEIPNDPQSYPPVPSLIRVMRSLTWVKIAFRSAICRLILSTAYITVVWSRPPNCSAMRG
jgi:hypothetical protein